MEVHQGQGRCEVCDTVTRFVVPEEVWNRSDVVQVPCVSCGNPVTWSIWPMRMAEHVRSWGTLEELAGW